MIDRTEQWVRLVLSLAVLALVSVALALHGLPDGPGLVEVIGIATLFGAVSAIRAVRALLR